MFIKRLLQLLRLYPRRRKRYMLLLALSLFALPLSTTSSTSGASSFTPASNIHSEV